MYSPWDTKQDRDDSTMMEHHITGPQASLSNKLQVMLRRTI